MGLLAKVPHILAESGQFHPGKFIKKINSKDDVVNNDYQFKKDESSSHIIMKMK